MRELKFRVWSEEDKQYRTDCDVFRLFHGKTGCPATIYNEEGDRFDIEQYTSLKDKNGKEIYEGDIVKMSLELAIRQVGFVSFAKGRFLIKDYEWEDGSYHIVDFFDYNIPNKDFEVIGNIHENPELLEEERK